MQNKTGKSGRPASSKTTHKSQKRKGGRKRLVPKVETDAKMDVDVDVDVNVDVDVDVDVDKDEEDEDEDEVDATEEMEEKVDEEAFDFQIIINEDDDDNLEEIELPEDPEFTVDDDSSDGGEDDDDGLPDGVLHSVAFTDVNIDINQQNIDQPSSSFDMDVDSDR